MLDNDKDKKKNKQKPGFNAQAFKHAIGMIESSGGKYLDNPTSSAAGKYHFLYKSIKDDPLMKGVSKREFINRPELQEQIMDKALSGKLKGYAYGNDYAKGLMSKYNTNHSVDELTALVHFLGPGNTRKYLKDPTNFKAPGTNASPQEYVNRFNKYFGEHPSELEKVKKTTPLPSTTPIENEMQYSQQVQDNTSVRQPMINRMPNQEIPQYNSEENASMSMNNFEYGGSMTGQSGAKELVTMFENGGTHEENPLGGIPQGMGANGKPNLVEEGETKFEDYIFSNNINIDGTYTDAGKSSKNQYKKGGMLKRADGSYSKRGLWDNIRANKGSGKKPTSEMLKQEKKINRMDEGGELNTGVIDPKKTKKSGRNESTGVVSNPMPNEGSEYPLTVTKTASRLHTKGSDMHVADNRAKYLASQIPFMPEDNNGGEVDWSMLNKDKNTESMINRYNDPWTRQKLKEQTGMSNYDIDNMLIRGLEAEEVYGGNITGSKASYSKDENRINTGKDYIGNTPVNMHERIHASGLDQVQGVNLINLLGNTFQQKEKKSLSQMSPEVARYLNMPFETYGNFVEFREKIGLKPGEQINVEELRKRIKNKKLSSENFIRAFDDDKVVEALNTIASTDNNNTDSYTLA